MNYTLKRKDANLAVFDIQGMAVDKCVIDKECEHMLPLPLKRLVKTGYKEEFVETETSDYYVLNKEGCYLFDNWLADREIPINRFNYDKYIKEGSNARHWLFENNGYSFNDCYWFESEREELQWRDIQKRLASLDSFYTVKGDNGMYKGNNATLGGQLEKFWYNQDGKTMLCKKVDMQYDVLAAREVMASLIYEKQHCNLYCPYQFIYHQNGAIAGTSCPSFTDELELVSAYDLLSEYNMTQVNQKLPSNFKRIQSSLSDLDSFNVWDKIILLADKVDFLITNRDRHQNNIAFLRNPETLKIISPAPIYDNGSSRHQEGLLPESCLETTVNGLYRTELECLSHVKNFDLIDLNKLPTREEMSAILDKCSGLAENRKTFLLDMYEEKKNLVRDLQKQFSLGKDIPEY